LLVAKLHRGASPAESRVHGYLKSYVRPEDISSRYRAEEFALILLEARWEIVRARAQTPQKGPRGIHKMPYTFEFDLTNGILRCRLRGQVTDERLKDFFRTGAEYAIRTHPAAGVVDLSEVTSFEVSAEAIREVAKSTPVLPDPNLRRVIIAPSPETYGMMRMFEIQGENKRPNIDLVRTESEAWTVLAVQNPRFDPLGMK